MAEKNYIMQAVVPEAPRIIDEQQLYVYIPQGSTDNFGVFKPDGQQFVITDNGILRVDASKLIQLATPSAQVVEDGGETSAEVQFTETDHTLLRQFQFIFKNIKGLTGATGLAALECSYVKTANKQPSPTEQINIPLNTFNRTPLSGEVATCYYVDSTTSITYLIKAGIISISGDHAICYIDSVLQFTGDKGADGLDALIYSGTYTEEYEGGLNDEPINLPIANFSRNPEIADTFLLVYSVTETGNVYIAVMSVEEVGTENVKCALVVGTVNLIRGPQGATGADGVSITSVTQTGVQGGTLVTITLSNGQSTSFTVYNGINTNFQVVDELPTENISTSTIYLILSDVQSEDNIYDEYIYVNGNWEHIGSTAVDLHDYVTKTFFNQNVGDATKNYIVAQLAKVHNLYIEMYESGSVPEVGQALTLTNANFARVLTVNQYFGLLEVVNTKDKYYSICQVLSVDTTTCSAKVVAVTEVTNGTEIDNIKASITALTTQLSGKADASALNDKLDKVATATTTKQAYVKNADGTQGMVNIGGTADDDIAMKKQVEDAINAAEPYHFTYNWGTVLTAEQKAGIQNDPNCYFLVTKDDGITYQYRRAAVMENRYYFTSMHAYTTSEPGGSINVGQMYVDITTENDIIQTDEIYAENLKNKTDVLNAQSTDDQYPTAKAVFDYVTSKEPYHVELTGDSGTITTEQYQALFADNDSYILHSVGVAVMRLARAVEVAGPISNLQYQKFIGGTARTISIQSSGAWTKTEVTYQSTKNQTTSLSTSSTDTQYPTAKAVVDYTTTAIANAITTTLNTPV